MKKCYIYILLMFVCFFGFSMGVKAEYQPICLYQRSNETTTDSVTIYYDKALNNHYKVIYTQDELVDESKQKESREYVFNKNKSGKIVGNINIVYSYANLSVSVCPKYADFDMGSWGSKVCFYDDDKGKSSCTENLAGTGPNYLRRKGAGVPLDNSSLTSANNSTVDNGKSCAIAIKLEGVDTGGNTRFCKIRFNYDGSNLKVNYFVDTNDNVDNVNWSSKSSATGDYFDCGYDDVKVTGGNTAGNTRHVTKNVHFTNSGGGFSSQYASVIINRRSDFNAEFLKYWEQGKECSEIITIDNKGHSTVGDALSYETDFYLLLPPAAAAAEEGGAKNIDANNFVDLKTWDYKWKNWYDNEGVTDCEGLIGDEIKELINDILMYVKILIPILLIGLGISDFIRAMVSSDEQAMAKAKNKFIKRLIIAAVIFVIPAITNLIFDTINGVWAHINNNACNIWN